MQERNTVKFHGTEEELKKIIFSETSISFMQPNLTERLHLKIPVQTVQKRCIFNKKMRIVLMQLIVPIILATFAFIAYFCDNKIVQITAVIIAYISACFWAIKNFADKISVTVPYQRQRRDRLGIERSWKQRPIWLSWIFECFGEDNNFEDGENWSN